MPAGATMRTDGRPIATQRDWLLPMNGAARDLPIF
jgi:hypothetical protein